MATQRYSVTPHPIETLLPSSCYSINLWKRSKPHQIPSPSAGPLDGYPGLRPLVRSAPLTKPF